MYEHEPCLWDADDTEYIATLDLGINFWDTADVYGAGMIAWRLNKSRSREPQGDDRDSMFALMDQNYWPVEISMKDNRVEPFLHG